MNNKTLANITIKISILEFELKGRGFIIALIQSTQKILKIFDHTTFQIAMSVCFL
jgi:hypothetical protein